MTLEVKIEDAQKALDYYEGKAEEAKAQAKQIIADAHIDANLIKNAAYDVARTVHEGISQDRAKMAEATLTARREADDLVARAGIEAKQITASANNEVARLQSSIKNLKTEEGKLSSGLELLQRQVDALRAKKAEIEVYLEAIRKRFAQP